MSRRAVESVRTYVNTWVALMVLLLLTVGVARLHLGPWNAGLALAIAALKAALVIVFFMHTRRSIALIRIFAATGFFWLAIQVSLTLSDVLSRGWLGPTSRK